MTTFPRSPKLLKGALVRLGEGFLGPIPNIIVFQYNPEKFTRTLNSAKTGKGEKEIAAKADVPTTTMPFDPGESFSLTLELDATDALENPFSHPVAMLTGIADRIAAIEMLLYPTGSDMISKAISQLTGTTEEVPKNKVPVVLFIWGPGRILPVRLKEFSIEEQAFSPTLFPLMAKVSIGMEVLTENSFPVTKNTIPPMNEQLAVAAYRYTKGLKEGLARANLLNSAESILGMLPF
ncbi:MAG: hypothetical protein WCJ26_11725 [bacterium]